MEYVKNSDTNPIVQCFSHPKHFTKKHSQDGFALVGSLILFSGLLIFTLLILKQTLHLKTWKKSQHECRHAAHKAQKHLAKGFVKLIELNPQALALRKERQKAELQLKLAIEPRARAAAKAYLLAVIARQSMFAAKQKQIIRSSQSLAKKELINTSFIKKDSPPFALMPRPRNSLTPNYVLPINFTRKQKLEITWKRNRHQLKFKGHCGATLKKDLLGFQPQFLFPET